MTPVLLCDLDGVLVDSAHAFVSDLRDVPALAARLVA